MMVLLTLVKVKRGMRPLLLKFGVALALSFAGFLYSYLKTRRIRPAHFLCYPPSSGDRDKVDSDGRPELKDESHCLQPMDALVADQNHVAMDNCIIELSPSSKHSGEEEGIFLPEFNEIVLKEFELPSISAGISPRKDVETAMATKNAADKETEQEIIHLRNMVKLLQERERDLEIQLLEYHGLKEQETTVMELQNRLKINNTDAKLLTLKIESLQDDNQRLEAQVADYARVVAELESVREKIKLLKGKIRSDREQSKELLSALQQKVANLQDLEHMAAGNDAVVQKKLQRLKELEDESAELKRANSSLQHENSELSRRLKSTQILASSVLEDTEAKALCEANHRLRQENEDLMKEFERLRADRCADVEELVYLRWLNACLRYELKNYQPPPGKTVARDLSKTLSPKSEEKAKQLILEYANSEEIAGKGVSLMDFDYDYWSSSQASNHADLGEFDDTCGEISSARRIHSSSKTKTKLFSKLKSLVHGKDSHNYDQTSSVDRNPLSSAASGRRESASNSFEEMSTYSCDSLSSHHNLSILATPLTTIEARTDRQMNKSSLSHNSLRTSLDIQSLRNLNMDDIRDVKSVRSHSDVGSSYKYKRMVLGESGVFGFPQDNRLNHDPDTHEKLELVKFAEILKGSCGTPRQHRKSASYCS